MGLLVPQISVQWTEETTRITKQNKSFWDEFFPSVHTVQTSDLPSVSAQTAKGKTLKTPLVCDGPSEILNSHSELEQNRQRQIRVPKSGTKSTGA